MPIYKVRIHYTSYEDIEVKATSREGAEDKAQIASGYNTKDIMNKLEVSQYDVELSDCQYTDQQELKDREDDHG